MRAHLFYVYTLYLDVRELRKDSGGTNHTRDQAALKEGCILPTPRKESPENHTEAELRMIFEGTAAGSEA